MCKNVAPQVDPNGEGNSSSLAVLQFRIPLSSTVNERLIQTHLTSRSDQSLACANTMNGGTNSPEDTTKNK